MPADAQRFAEECQIGGGGGFGGEGTPARAPGDTSRPGIARAAPQTTSHACQAHTENVHAGGEGSCRSQLRQQQASTAARRAQPRAATVYHTIMPVASMNGWKIISGSERETVIALEQAAKRVAGRRRPARGCRLPNVAVLPQERRCPGRLQVVWHRACGRPAYVAAHKVALQVASTGIREWGVTIWAPQRVQVCTA